MDVNSAVWEGYIKGENSYMNTWVINSSIQKEREVKFQTMEDSRNRETNRNNSVYQKLGQLFINFTPYSIFIILKNNHSYWLDMQWAVFTPLCTKTYEVSGKINNSFSFLHLIYQVK